MEVAVVTNLFGFGEDGDVIDGFGTEMFLNHSCDPNCETNEINNRIWILAIRDIAPDQSPILRFGGDSTDWTWWPVKGMKKPGGIKYALNDKWLQVAHAMDTALHSRLILGVNLEANNLRIARTMGSELVKGIGKSSIAGLEIGNEPELYTAFNWGDTGRPGRNKATWNTTSFAKQFHQFASAMPSGVRWKPKACI